jgi:hypothetical protein
VRDAHHDGSSVQCKNFAGTTMVEMLFIVSRAKPARL